MSNTTLFVILGAFAVIAYIFVSKSSVAAPSIQNTSPSGPSSGYAGIATALAPSALNAITSALGQSDTSDDTDDDGCC